ncbi:MAG: hypothetical protein ACHQUA_00370 [Microgenomates group bacterium]
MCENAIVVSASGFETREAAADAVRKLGSKLNASVNGGTGATEDGFGYTASFACKGFTSRGKCFGVCVKAKLEEMGKLEGANVYGNCMVEEVTP